MLTIKKASHILPVIVGAQFLCTSLWFAGNAVIPDLVRDFDLGSSALGHITAAVQFGFIVGTLVYALLTIADRFSPSSVFFISAIAAASCNLAIALPGQQINSLLILRFLTGFFLAGIYPVGMKIAADHFEKGLGKALGFLVGALVIGTAFPHLLKNFTATLPWKLVLFLTSGLSLAGGVLIRLLVPDGPYRKKGQQLNLRDIFKPFRDKTFRSAAFGYFGHMWELYTFWAFVPVMLSTYTLLHPQASINIPVCSFVVIGVGGLACIASGFIAEKHGGTNTAFAALLLSCCCCLLSPLAFNWPLIGFLLFLICWGLVVIADSPVFSGLVAQNAPPASKGTALTIVVCIGFSITIGSIELINMLTGHIGQQYLYLFLAAGPIIGLLYMLKAKDNTITGGLYKRLRYSGAADIYRNVFNPAKRRQALNESRFYHSFLQPCSLIFDIGANDGHKTIAFSAMAGKVIACEPDPQNIDILRSRFRNRKTVVIEPFAISDHVGTSTFFIHEPGSALNTINPNWKKILEEENKGRWNENIQFSGSEITVNCITLDMLIKKHGLPDFIKIDVEGNEQKVLSGLSHPVACVSFEVLLPEFREDAIACMDMLLKLAPNTRFNYAMEENLVLPQFISAADFKELLSGLSVNHFEIIATTRLMA